MIKILLSQIITYMPKFIFQLIVAIFTVYLICRENPFFRAQNKSFKNHCSISVKFWSLFVVFFFFKTRKWWVFQNKWYSHRLVCVLFYGFQLPKIGETGRKLIYFTSKGGFEKLLSKVISRVFLLRPWNWGLGDGAWLNFHVSYL